MSEIATQPHARGQSGLALRFFAIALMLTAAATALARTLTWILPDPSAHRLLPPVFWSTTLLLAAGSFELHCAVTHVRRERQHRFRRCLRLATGIGTLFVGLQGYGLWSLLRFAESGDAQTGVKAFVFMLTFLHAMHFTVALGFLVYVTLQAQIDRYDHEYYWGVAACGYFWHFLGAVWIAILAVFAIASL